MSGVRSPSDRPKAAPSKRKKAKRRKKPVWWRRAAAAVIAAGALAAAVSAILELRPDPDPADKVTISSAVVIPQPLSTFVATATIRPLDGANLINPFRALPDLRSTETPEVTAAPSAATATATSGGSTTSTGSGTTASSESTETGSSSSSSTTTSGGTATTTSGAIGTDLPPPAVLDVPGDVRDELDDALHESPDLEKFVLPDRVLPPPIGGPNGARVAYAQHYATDQNGDPLPVEEAARNLAAQLEQVRSVPNEGRRDPLGVRVTVDLEVQGLRGVDLYLYWRLLAAGSNPVPETLAMATPAFMITPGTDLDSASVDAWVPLPENPGPYQLELLVTDGTEAAALDSLHSDPFD